LGVLSEFVGADQADPMDLGLRGDFRLFETTRIRYIGCKVSRVVQKVPRFV
jgi:hypothetical protein